MFKNGRAWLAVLRCKPSRNLLNKNKGSRSLKKNSLNRRCCVKISRSMGAQREQFKIREEAQAREYNELKEAIRDYDKYDG